jgi:hypothetical protein
MGVLVLKRWTTSGQPIDKAGTHIVISGREAGIGAWLLARLGVDPTTTVRVTRSRIEFRSSSLSGTHDRLIPLRGVCSTYYGYDKPWIQAVALFLLLGWLLGGLAAVAASSIGGLLLGTLAAGGLALLYYFLNRTLTLGFVEYSGVVSGIRFKRSVIENIDVNEQQARHACELTQWAIEEYAGGGQFPPAQAQ